MHSTRDPALNRSLGIRIHSSVSARTNTVLSFRTRDVAEETKRICAIGCLTPAAWMKQAVGGEISPRPLIEDTARALAALT